MIVEFIAGAAVGVIGMVVKDKYAGNASTQEKNAKQREFDEIYAENEKFRKRNKEMERQIEDLLSDNQKMRRQLKEKEGNQDDLDDDLQSAKREIAKLKSQNDELCGKIQEYKDACYGYKLEIERLKEKLV